VIDGEAEAVGHHADHLVRDAPDAEEHLVQGRPAELVPPHVVGHDHDGCGALHFVRWEQRPAEGWGHADCLEEGGRGARAR
jgi:hypothetical protein